MSSSAAKASQEAAQAALLAELDAEEQVLAASREAEVFEAEQQVKARGGALKEANVSSSSASSGGVISGGDPVAADSAIPIAERLARDLEATAAAELFNVADDKRADDKIELAMANLKALRASGASEDTIAAAIENLEVALSGASGMATQAVQVVGKINITSPTKSIQAQQSSTSASLGGSVKTYSRPLAPPPLEEEEPRVRTVTTAKIPGTFSFAERIATSYKIERPAGAPPLTDDDIAQGAATFARIMAKNAAEKDREAKRRRALEIREHNENVARRKKEIAKEKERREEEERKVRERAKEIALAQAGRTKLRVLPPPPPPFEPFKFVELGNNSTSIIPRGKIMMSITRVSGLNGSGNIGGDTTAAGATRTSSAAKTSFFTMMSGSSRGDTKMIASTEDGEKVNVSVGNVYCRFELLLGTTRIEARTPVYRNVILNDFEMFGADVEFRISTGIPLPKYPSNASAPEKGKLPPILFYSVWRVGRSDEYLLGEGNLPAGMLFTESPMGDSFNISLPLFSKGEGGNAHTAKYRDGNILAWISAKFQFRPTASGILTVTVSEALDLQSYGLGGTAMPYPRIECGVGSNKNVAGQHIGGALPVPEITVRGSVCIEGGSNPMFNHEELVLWIDHEHGASDTCVVVSLCVDSVIEGTKVLGSFTLPVHDWTKSVAPIDDLLDLRATSIFGLGTVGDYVGRVVLQRRFYPAGLLTVKVLRSLEIVSSDITGTSDAYVKCSLEGRARSYVVNTKTILHAGPNPVFGETFIFDVVDHADLRIGVWDFDRTTADDLVGEVLIDLAGVFEFGVRDAVVPIKRPNLWGGLSDTGFLHLEIDFVGQLELAYPMLQAMRASFKGDKRELREKLTTKEKMTKSSKAIDDEDEDIVREMALHAEKEGAEWVDDDIEAAFKMLDMNKDLYIGKTELRHALLSFGETVTTLEVSIMVVSKQKHAQREREGWRR